MPISMVAMQNVRAATAATGRAVLAGAECAAMWQRCKCVCVCVCVCVCARVCVCVTVPGLAAEGPAGGSSALRLALVRRTCSSRHAAGVSPFI